jgi:uncharacterized protein (DUF169 family)
MDHETVASSLAANLTLDQPPVALAFVQEQPEGVERSDTTVPSSCSFWRQAEAGVFYADAESHFSCAVGAFVMGFELPPAVHEALGGAVEMMCAADYLAADEPASMPTVGKPKRGIVYGPLAEFPLEPDVVLMWLSPRDAMIFSEAAGSARWGAEVAKTVFGRPGCAAIPSALDSDRPVLSLGCTGMRTFTEIAGDSMLAVVPGPRVAELAEAVADVCRSNQIMGDYYEQRKSAFAPAS